MEIRIERSAWGLVTFGLGVMLFCLGFLMGDCTGRENERRHIQHSQEISSARAQLLTV